MGRKPFSRRELFDELALFLRRHTPLTPLAAPAIPLETPIARELVTELKRLQIKDWPALCTSLAVNGTKDFATRLDALGQQWKCPSLVDYARTLALHAETYAVVDMERQLRDFGALVARLEQTPSA